MKGRDLKVLDRPRSSAAKRIAAQTVAERADDRPERVASDDVAEERGAEERIAEERGATERTGDDGASAERRREQIARADGPERRSEPQSAAEPAASLPWWQRLRQFIAAQTFSSLTRRIVSLNVAGLVALVIGI